MEVMKVTVTLMRNLSIFGLFTSCSGRSEESQCGLTDVPDKVSFKLIFLLLAL